MLRGVAHKGPFVQSSTVTVSVLDAQLQPTTQTLVTNTDATGAFSLTNVASGSLAVEVTGYYYNEVAGGLSDGPLTLRTLHVSEGSTAQVVNVNLVTHLTSRRIRTLVLGGATFADATNMAEEELRVGLAITPSTFAPTLRGSEMTVNGTTDSDAYLLALSSVVAQAASHRAAAVGGGVNGHMQDLVNGIANDLETDGLIASALTSELNQAELLLDVPTIETTLLARLTATGATANVPNMRRVLDSDDDDFADAFDNCPAAANADQGDVDNDGVGDVCDTCPQTKCAATTDLCVPAGASSDLQEDVCLSVASAGCSGTDVPVHWSLPGEGVHDICATPCDPKAATPCRADEACAVMPHAYTGGLSQWVCVPAPAGILRSSPGSVCDASAGQCGAGLACVGGACAELCEPTAPACANAATCTPRTWLPGTADLGTCPVRLDCAAEGTPTVFRIGGAAFAGGRDLDQINNWNKPPSGDGVGPTIAGCGRTDARYGVDNAFASLQASLQGIVELNTWVQTLPFDITLTNWNGTNDDNCVNVSMTVGGSTIATSGGQLIAGALTATSEDPLVLPVDPQFADGMCTGGACMTCGGMPCLLDITVYMPRLDLDLDAATPALLSTSALTGIVFYEDASVTGLSGFRSAFNDFAATIGLGSTDTLTVQSVMTNMRDIRLQSSTQRVNCSGADVNTTDRNSLSFGITYSGVKQ